MRKLILGLALASSILPAAGAMAQTPPAAERDMASQRPHRDGPRGIMRADTNRDGVITRQEARAAADRLFAARDANRDGRLTAEELRSRHHARRGGEAPRTARMKHELTRADFERKAMRRFDRLDANNDGRVATAEVRQHRLEKRQHRAQADRQQG